MNSLRLRKPAEITIDYIARCMYVDIDIDNANAKRSVRQTEHTVTVIIDYDENSNPIGIEIIGVTP